VVNSGPSCFEQVLEPKNDKSVATRDWEKMGSDISELGLWDDDEQPLPTNVMYPGACLNGSFFAECVSGFNFSAIVCLEENAWTQEVVQGARKLNRQASAASTSKLPRR